MQTDFKWKSNDFDKLKKYGNFSCRFSSRDGKRVAYTKARMEVYPYGNPDDQALPTHYRCQNPSWTVPEEARLDVSVNGQEYIGDFTFTFYEALDVFRIAPLAGPNEGKTRVKIFGSGFKTNSSDDVFVKWGIVETQKLLKEDVLDYIWDENDFISHTMVQGSDILMAYKKESYNSRIVDAPIKDRTRLRTYVTQSPRLPNWSKTHGGPMYMSMGEHFQINKV